MACHFPQHSLVYVDPGDTMASPGKLVTSLLILNSSLPQACNTSKHNLMQLSKLIRNCSVYFFSGLQSFMAVELRMPITLWQGAAFYSPPFSHILRVWGVLGMSLVPPWHGNSKINMSAR